MRKHVLLLLALALLLPAAATAFENQIGFGLHYWTALDDLGDEGFDESGTSIYGAWRLGTPGPLAFEVDLEYFDDSFAGADGSALSPQVYVLLGGFVYGGVGVGVTFADLPDGSDVSDPFWAARLGLSIPLFVRVRLDVNANYQADSFANLGNASSDSITLGAALRFKLD